jgi:hypothetical protein
MQPQQAASFEGQRVSAMRFGDPKVQALFAVVVIFSLQSQDSATENCGDYLSQALGSDNQQITQGKMSYDLPTAAPTRTNRKNRRYSTLRTLLLHIKYQVKGQGTLLSRSWPNEKPVSNEVVDSAGCIFEPFCRRLQDCCISRPAKTLRSSAFTSETAQNTNPSRSQCETL